jgi:NAD(P)-dependent dehydrogenase (short-subunit alcohol dehydrogenase family)
MNATPDFGPMGKTWGSYGPSLLYSQLFTWIPAPNHDFSGQTVIVTGSNTGIGLEAARILVQLNAAKVILAVRTVSKGEAAAEDIIRTTRATRNRLEVWQLDISSPDSIKKFVAKAQKLDRLDAVIQNAGVLSAKWSTINGVESHIAVNVIGASLFGLQILPKMRESAKKHNSRGRLTFVGSDTQYVALWKEQYYAGSLLDNLSDERMADIDDR